MRSVRFFDTTMRDGEQGIGFLMTREQKLSLLEELAALDVAAIELGMVNDDESRALFEQAALVAGSTRSIISAMAVSASMATCSTWVST